MVWPLTEYVAGSARYYALDVEGFPSWKLIHSGSDYESFIIDWLGPLAQRATVKQSPKKPVLGVPRSAPQSLLQTAASNGFWSLAKTSLVALMRQEQLSVPPQCSLVDALESLCRHAHPKARDEDIMAMLASRVTERSPDTSYLKSEVCKDLLDKSDHKEVEETERNTDGKQKEHNAIQSRVNEMKKAIGSKPKSTAKSST
eukprot:3108787-Amphidinium_carterae.1